MIFAKEFETVSLRKSKPHTPPSHNGYATDETECCTGSPEKSDLPVNDQHQPTSSLQIRGTLFSILSERKPPIKPTEVRGAGSNEQKFALSS